MEVAEFCSDKHAVDYLDREENGEYYFAWKPILDAWSVQFVKLTFEGHLFNGGAELRSNMIIKECQNLHMKKICI